MTGVDLSRLVTEVARSRDRTAFARLFDHYTPRLKTYFLHCGVPRAQAEDLAQETLLAVWCKAAQFDPALGSASSWIFTIARNLRISALHREHHPAAGDPELSPVRDDAPDPERALISADTKNLLHHALGDLPEHTIREVML